MLTASDGVEAIKVYTREQQRVDVVLLDMIMPRMSGRECYSQLRKINSDVRVIATSGYTSAEKQQELINLGLTDQLPKPYRRAELSRAVSSVIRREAVFTDNREK